MVECLIIVLTPSLENFFNSRTLRAIRSVWRLEVISSDYSNSPKCRTDLAFTCIHYFGFRGNFITCSSPNWLQDGHTVFQDSKTRQSSFYLKNMLKQIRTSAISAFFQFGPANRNPNWHFIWTPSIVAAPRIWNGLPHELRQCNTTLPCFKPGDAGGCPSMSLTPGTSNAKT